MLRRELLSGFASEGAGRARDSHSVCLMATSGIGDASSSRAHTDIEPIHLCQALQEKPQPQPARSLPGKPVRVHQKNTKGFGVSRRGRARLGE